MKRKQELLIWRSRMGWEDALNKNLREVGKPIWGDKEWSNEQSDVEEERVQLFWPHVGWFCIVLSVALVLVSAK